MGTAIHQAHMSAARFILNSACNGPWCLNQVRQAAMLSETGSNGGRCLRGL